MDYNSKQTGQIYVYIYEEKKQRLMSLCTTAMLSHKTLERPSGLHQAILLMHAKTRTHAPKRLCVYKVSMGTLEQRGRWVVNKVSGRHCISPGRPFVPRDSESTPLHVCDYEPVVHLASFPGIVYNKKKKKQGSRVSIQL